MAKKNKQNFLKENSDRQTRQSKFFLPERTKKYISEVGIILLAVIIILSFFELAGPAGRGLRNGLLFLIGRTTFIFPLILLLVGFIYLRSRYKKIFYSLILVTFIFVLGMSGIFELLSSQERHGGWLGYFATLPLLKLFGFWLSQIIFAALLIICIVIFWHLLIPFQPEKEETGKEKKSIIARLFKKENVPRLKIKEVPFSDSVSLLETVKPEKIIPELKTRPIEAKDFSYELPPIILLESERGIASPGDTRTNAAIIKKTLQNFDIPVEMSEVNIGPTVTQYTLKPSEGVKLSKITALNNDLALALAAHPIRIEAPVPGKSLVGIELPNKVRAQVRLRDLIENESFQKSFSILTIILGRDVSGNPIYTDLARMPHLLVAGSTGTGKTIFLNDLILSLLYQNSPQILRFILIDPKRVEFAVYNELPHLLCPVIFGANQAINALKWLILEMERRFDILSASGTRDIAGYNSQIVKKEGEEKVMPYIVLIIDELADLMAAKGREVEAGIVRLAQMARAVGVHLVVATQRPSVEVITGLIKANITSRISFQVASQVDSRTILDMAGAEKLLGSGDLLYLSAELGKPRRIQSAFVSEKEVKKVVNWIKAKTQPSEFKVEQGFLENGLAKDLKEAIESEEMKQKEFNSDEDPLYEEAKKEVILARKGSASFLQRRLRIGYARAARLLDTLEERGVVGPGEGAKPREVYIKTDEEDEEKWKKV